MLSRTTGLSSRIGGGSARFVGGVHGCRRRCGQVDPPPRDAGAFCKSAEFAQAEVSKGVRMIWGGGAGDLPGDRLRCAYCADVQNRIVVRPGHADRQRSGQAIWIDRGSSAEHGRWRYALAMPDDSERVKRRRLALERTVSSVNPDLPALSPGRTTPRFTRLCSRP